MAYQSCLTLPRAAACCPHTVPCSGAWSIGLGSTAESAGDSIRRCRRTHRAERWSRPLAHCLAACVHVARTRASARPDAAASGLVAVHALLAGASQHSQYGAAWWEQVLMVALSPPRLAAGDGSVAQCCSLRLLFRSLSSTRREPAETASWRLRTRARAGLKRQVDTLASLPSLLSLPRSMHVISEHACMRDISE